MLRRAKILTQGRRGAKNEEEKPEPGPEKGSTSMTTPLLAPAVARTQTEFEAMINEIQPELHRRFYDPEEPEGFQEDRRRKRRVSF